MEVSLLKMVDAKDVIGDVHSVQKVMEQIMEKMKKMTIGKHLLQEHLLQKQINMEDVICVIMDII